MNNSSEKKSGLALIIFTILLVFTMVLHPAGGNIEHLIKISSTIIVTHSIAIISLPFGLIGFRGVTKRLGKDEFWSMLAFSIIIFGLIAVMIAAATNGLILPIFLQNYKDANAATIDSIKPILHYGFAINHAFDYIYTAAFCFAIICWSITIIHGRRMPQWLGWMGGILAIGGIMIFTTGIAHTLYGFRLFVSLMVIWIFFAGISLRKPLPDQRDDNSIQTGA